MTASPSHDMRLARAPAPLANRARHAVFLCYHSIHPDGPPFLSVPPDMFASQLAALRRAGFAAGTIGALDRLAAGERMRCAFVTFDDGFVDNYTTAWPLLREQGFTGLVFLVTGQVGAEALDWPLFAEARATHPDVVRPVNWSMVEEMAQHGMEFGAHTVSHADLRGLEDDALREELLDSRRVLRDRLGRCDALAYPFGEWDLRVAFAAADAGYRYAFALAPCASGLTTPLSIPRVLVDHRDDTRRFAFKLRASARRLMLSPSVRMTRSRLNRGPLRSAPTSP